MKPLPDNKVRAWMDFQETTQLFITTITIAEISYGIKALAQGQRREALENAFNNAIIEAFKHRIFDFDEFAAHQYGKLMSQRKTLGRPMSTLDGQIAAIALSRKMSLATRNIKNFSNCEITLINPFEL